jgi:alpha-beta hydrolase superfamily lysophospholipase
MLLILLLAVLVVWYFGPYEPVKTDMRFDEDSIGEDVDAYFAAREARFDDIVPGVEKRVIWHGAPGQKTRQVLLYVHGFSASSEELRPVPDRIAAGMGANLVYTRLTGHGRTGEAMSEGTVEAWMGDVAEALAVARRVGDEVILLATSTGATLLAEAALQPEMMRAVKGAIFVSPNFAIADSAAPALTLPAARYWVPLVAGKTRSFEPRNAAQETYWTTSYPTVSVLPLAALVKHARNRDWAQAKLPVLFWYSDADLVVKPEATDRVVSAWGGEKTVIKVEMGEGSDPYAHVIAGAIASPPQTEQAVSDMLHWIGGL